MTQAAKSPDEAEAAVLTSTAAVPTFQHEVHLAAVAVAVVKQARRIVLPCDLPMELHGGECLEGHAGKRAGAGDPGPVSADEVAQQAAELCLRNSRPGWGETSWR